MTGQISTPVLEEKKGSALDVCSLLIVCDNNSAVMRYANLRVGNTVLSKRTGVHRKMHGDAMHRLHSDVYYQISH